MAHADLPQQSIMDVPEVVLLDNGTTVIVCITTVVFILNFRLSERLVNGLVRREFCPVRNGLVISFSGGNKGQIVEE